ncbi:MAG: hypothetical protein Q7O66_16805 [Dehalococcoidia bacterium]|nr:hypothetical protein [Dehalococcoidia bacterium]
MTFGVMTSEERQALIAKAVLARAANSAARKASTLRRDFLDAEHWEELARERGLRLPPWGERATVSNMRTWLHKTGWSQAECEAWAGCKLADLIALNPTWALRALAGIVLEQQGTRDDGLGEGADARGNTAFYFED